jgi:hypothetical protein
MVVCLGVVYEYEIILVITPLVMNSLSIVIKALIKDEIH